MSVVGDLCSRAMTTPHLEVIWHSYIASTQQVFRCVANGMGSDEQLVSESSTVQVGPMDAGCCHKMGKLQTAHRFIRHDGSYAELDRGGSISNYLFEHQICRHGSYMYHCRWKSDNPISIFDKVWKSLKISSMTCMGEIVPARRH